jgi:poly-beta-hydroxybutyrate-responsive repressor
MAATRPSRSTAQRSVTEDAWSGPSHPTGDMLNAQLLAMLKDWSAYGYELAQQLDQAGFGNYNKGTVYRALRQMESGGLVSSIWQTSSAGPARRMYSTTEAGNLFLQSWLTLLNLHRATLERSLSDVRNGDRHKQR